MTNHLLLYTTTTCQTCRTAKRRLDAEGIPYTEINVESDEEGAERLKRNGFDRAPVFGWAGRLFTLADLPRIIREAKGDVAA